jgi:hypothetical protein
MSENWQSRTTHTMRNIIRYVALLVLAFLIGLVPMWLASRQTASNLAEAERELSLVMMENSLASAAIAARRGDYETARQAASDFFTSLRTETTAEGASALSEAEIASLQPLLTRRDEIITALARGEATAADLLSDLYVTYRDLVGQ